MYVVSQKTTERTNRVLQMITKYMPDSFGVQEATQQWLDIFERELGDEYGVVAQMRDGAEDSEASAVYYLKEKFELLDSGTIWLSKTPEVFASKLGNGIGAKVIDGTTGKEMNFRNIKKGDHVIATGAYSNGSFVAVTFVVTPSK